MKRLSVVLAALMVLVAMVACDPPRNTAPVRVGILHSQTGTMALSEVPVVEATMLAIDELNSRGGLMGRQIEPVIVDGKSDWDVFAAGAEKLITSDEVDVVFGCWTSASRKTVRPVFEKHKNLLFYPVQYEGAEQSPNIVYTGAAPNQQIIPSVSWAYDSLEKRRFFLVGSDYVFPRTANAIIRDFVVALGGEISGEEYIALGSTDVGGAIEKIKFSGCDVILNTINGDSNVAFFKELRAAGITPELIPTISYSIAEPELQSMDAESMAGDYAAWNYFMAVDSEANRAFIESFQAKYGKDRVTSDPLEAAYFGVMLWAHAAEDAESTAPADVLTALRDLSYDAPGGIVHVDAETLHTWKTVRIGRIRSDAQFEIVWTSDRPVRPVPYPRTRTREEWDQFVNGLYTGWGGHWAAPSGT